MTITIGNSILPGTVTTVESGPTRAVDSPSPADVGFVGQADLQKGDADPNQVYAIQTSVQARRRFGAGSKLAVQVQNGLGEGGLPIFAVAPAATQVTDEALDDDQLDNAPAPEDGSKVTFTDSTATTYEARVTYGDPANSPDSDTSVIYYNPVTGATQPRSDLTGVTVNYEHYDYTAAVEAMENQRGDRVDFIVPLIEAESVVQSAHDAVKRMEQRYNLAMVQAGAPNTMDLADATTVGASVNFDSSRMQQFYPSRKATGETIMGGVGGKRAALGIDNSIMSKRLATAKDLMVTLNRTQMEDLVTNTIVPMADESRGAKFRDDITMVADDNLGESAMRDSLSRLVIDYVIDIENANSERFIGEFNRRSTRDSLRDVIAGEMNRLLRSKVLESFSVYTYEIDAVTAGLEIGIDTVDPLRNIEATVTAGEVQDVADQASALVTGGFETDQTA